MQRARAQAQARPGAGADMPDNEGLAHEQAEPAPQEQAEDAGALQDQADTAAPSRAPGFKRPDISGFIPATARDAVQRLVAAGMKLLYSGPMRQDVIDATRMRLPVPQKLAMSTAALMQTLDQQSRGGIPVQALFPAALTLLGEAGEILSATGQRVTQDDFNQAALQLSILLAKKLGASDEQAMQLHRQMLKPGQALGTGAGVAAGAAPSLPAGPSGAAPGASPGASGAQQAWRP